MKTARRTATGERDSETVALQLEALTAHYRHAYGGLHLHTIGIVGSPEVADDIVQEAFANTAAAILRGTEIVHLNAWLKRCIRNLSINHLELKQLLPLEEAEEMAGNDSPLETAHTKMTCEAVYGAVRELTPAQRSAFLMAEFHDLNYREIADHLNRSVDAVRHILARARKYVRDAVGPGATSATAPIVPLNHASHLSPKLRSHGLRDLIAAKLQSVSGAVSSALQRSVDAVSQPTVVIVSSTLVVGTLGGGLPGTGSPAEVGSAGSPEIAATSVPAPRGLLREGKSSSQSSGDVNESSDGPKLLPGATGKDARGADEVNAGRVPLDDPNDGQAAAATAKNSYDTEDSTVAIDQPQSDEQAAGTGSDGSCQAGSGAEPGKSACIVPISVSDAPPGAERTVELDHPAVDVPRAPLTNGSTSVGGGSTSSSSGSTSSVDGSISGSGPSTQDESSGSDSDAGASQPQPMPYPNAAPQEKPGT